MSSVPSYVSVERLAGKAVPVGVGLLLGVEGPLVDQALFSSALGGRYFGSLTAIAVLRSVAKLSVHAETRRSCGSSAETHVVDVALVLDQAAGVVEDDHVAVGELRVGVGHAEGLHRGLVDAAAAVGELDGAGEQRGAVDVERRLLRRAAA